MNRTVWIPEAPKHPGVYANATDTYERGKIRTGEKQPSTMHAHHARQFATQEECRAWCDANPDPPFVPRCHGFDVDDEDGLLREMVAGLESAACGCSRSGGFICSRCKALELGRTALTMPSGVAYRRQLEAIVAVVRTREHLEDSGGIMHRPGEWLGKIMAPDGERPAPCAICAVLAANPLAAA